MSGRRCPWGHRAHRRRQQGGGVRSRFYMNAGGLTTHHRHGCVTELACATPWRRTASGHVRKSSGRASRSSGGAALRARLNGAPKTACRLPRAGPRAYSSRRREDEDEHRREDEDEHPFCCGRATGGFRRQSRLVVAEAMNPVAAVPPAGRPRHPHPQPRGRATGPGRDRPRRRPGPLNTAVVAITHAAPRMVPPSRSET